MTTIEQQVSVFADAAQLYDAFAKASCLATWLGPAHFKVNQQFGSVMLKLCGELDFAVSETRSPVTVSWKCMTKRHAWTNTRVLFSLGSLDDRTIVTVRHGGLAEERLLALTESFWSSVLDSLKAQLEMGDGQPRHGFPEALRLT